MSAIAGIMGLKTAPETRIQMMKAMATRGGAGIGCAEIRDAVLLQTQAETELCQPMALEWAGESYRICWDGELYNSKALRQELISLGHFFEGETSAETFLHAYAQWGEKAVEKCNGVFALAILEENNNRLFLTRDRIGVKPLFYSQVCGGLVFASQIRTILSHESVTAELDAEGAAQILLLGPGRIPGSGVLRGIFELEPGCCASFENRHIYLRRYWKLQDAYHDDTFAETVEKVRYMVFDAIKGQMEAEGSVAAFLSGGLDSSLISSVCAGVLAEKGERLKTFSVDYLDNDIYFKPGRFQPNSDPEFIYEMQTYLHSDHHWTILSPQELVSGIEESTAARELPGMADVDISMALLCKDAKKYTDVVMSGECADEIFGGYPWYRDPMIRNFDGFPWAQTTKERVSFAAPWILEQVQPEDFVQEQYRKTLQEADILPENDPTNRRIKQLVNLNFRWFMQTLLDRTDRMSAMCGLNVRVPLCDYRIAEYLYHVPWEMKNYNGREKGLLREAMKGFLPEKVLYRKKSPFPKTHDPKYLTLVSEALEKLLRDPKAPIYQLVRREALENLLHQDFPWPWYGQLMRRPQTIVYMLQINFWLKNYSVRIA